MRTFKNLQFPTIAHRNSRYEQTKVFTMSADKHKEYMEMIQSGTEPETLTDLYYINMLQNHSLPIEVNEEILMRMSVNLIVNMVEYKHVDLWFDSQYLKRAVSTLLSEIKNSDQIFSISEDTEKHLSENINNYFATKDGKSADLKALGALGLIIFKLDKNPEVHIYQGNPGTGKSYQVNVQIHEHGYKNVLVASLANIVGLRFKSKDPEIYTHYSFTKLKYTRFQTLQEKEFDAIVVEEASMISSAEFAAIAKLASLEKPIYFMGDTNQLPGFTGFGNLFYTLLNRYRSNSVFLTENHRMEVHSDLLDLMNIVKSTGKLPKFNIEESDGSIDAWLEHCKNGDNTMAVTYRLKDVVWLNNLVIKHVLEFDSSYTADSNGKNINIQDWEAVLHEAARKSVSLPVISKAQIFDDQTKTYMFYNGEQATAKFVDGDWILTYQDASVRGENTKVIISEKTLLYNFKLGYAMTIHCAQGSEWDYVLYYEPSINRYMDYPLNLRFVGVTRARRQTLLAADDPPRISTLRFYTFNLLKESDNGK